MLWLALSCAPHGVGRPQRAKPLLREALYRFTTTKAPPLLPHARFFSSSACEDGEDSSSAQGNGSKERTTTGDGGFDWRNTRSRKKLLSALRTYREVNGNLLVPQAFVVLSGDKRWPQEAWGYRLGVAVSGLRQRLKKSDQDLPLELAELGLTLDVFQYRWHEIILPALRKFYALHGHTDVPGTFVVPTSDDAWPKPSWGWSLGFSVSRIRVEKAYSVQVTESLEELKSMDFCFTSIPDRDWTEKVIPSLQVFRQEFGHCIIDVKFKVPSSSHWPRKAWGMPLGVVASTIRSGKNYVEQCVRDKDILDQVGFAWDFYESMWNERIIPAMEAFVAEYGHCKVGEKFVVPECDPWPQSVWGMSLGRTMSDMRYGAAHLGYVGRDVDRLQALGYHFKLSKKAWNRRVAPLVELYATIFGHERIPEDFIIPPEPVWPKAMWGVALGYIIARNSRHLPLDWLKAKE